MKKSTIAEMKRLAEEKKGECLSKIYANHVTPLKWKCEKGHRWEAPPSLIKRGHWCRICAFEKWAYSIKDMQELAAISGGQCLSKKYVNIATPLKFKCAKGHVWSTRPSSILKGSWCPSCAGRAKGTIGQMRKIARSRGGKCLSKSYVTTRTKLLWQCSKGHTWEARPDHVKRGSWCPVCSGRKRKTMEHMHELATSRGGKCLSKKYTNSGSKLRWECRKGHKWWAEPHHIQEGRWCSKCNGEERRKEKLEELQDIAKARGGKCLSDFYVDSHTKLEWECSKGHTWWTTPSVIKQGSWCPYYRNRSD
jgi:hypothetical protein